MFTKELDELISEINYLKLCEKKLEEIVNLPGCLDCANRRACKYFPGYGELSRFNCPLYVSE